MGEDNEDRFSLGSEEHKKHDELIKASGEIKDCTMDESCDCDDCQKEQIWPMDR